MDVIDQTPEELSEAFEPAELATMYLELRQEHNELLVAIADRVREQAH